MEAFNNATLLRGATMTTMLNSMAIPERKPERRVYPVNETPQEREAKKTMVITDPNEFVRESVACLFEERFGFEIVAQTSRASEAIPAIEEFKPSLYVLDIELPRRSGIELVHELRRRGILVPTIVLTHIADRHTCDSAINSGALAYLLKSDPVDEFKECFGSMKRGRPHISKSLQTGHYLDSRPRLAGNHSNDPLEPLSPREREVFHLLADGLQNSQIAKKLFISPRTVETHRARVVRKLGLKTNGEIIRFAIKNGLSMV